MAACHTGLTSLTFGRFRRIDWGLAGTGISFAGLGVVSSSDFIVK
jgi:hypothetical protein